MYADATKLKELWYRLSLMAALTTLLFFAVYGFHNMLLHGKVIYAESNKFVASLELSMSLIALIGISYLLIAEYNPHRRSRTVE